MQREETVFCGSLLHRVCRLRSDTSLSFCYHVLSHYHTHSMFSMVLPFQSVGCHPCSVLSTCHKARRTSVPSCRVLPPLPGVDENPRSEFPSRVPSSLDGPAPAPAMPDPKFLELRRSVLGFGESFVFDRSVSHQTPGEVDRPAAVVQNVMVAGRSFLQRKHLFAFLT